MGKALKSRVITDYERRVSLRMNSPWTWALRGIVSTVLSQLGVSAVIWPALWLMSHFFVGVRDMGWDLAVVILALADVAVVVAGTALLVTATQERLPAAVSHEVALLEAKLTAEAELEDALQLSPR